MAAHCLTEWLRFGVVSQALKKLKDWSYEDLVALAIQQFGTTWLNKQQLVALIKHLREKQPAKAELAYYAQVPGKIFKHEVVWRNNPVGEATTGWKDAAGHLKPVFANAEDTLDYALALLVVDETLSWKELQAIAKRSQQKQQFNPLVPNGPVAPALQKTIAKQAQQLKALLAPMPDNLDLNRRYWSLEPGDSVLDAKGHLKAVLSVQINPGKPPTVRIET